jgi:hypothetical protein
MSGPIIDPMAAMAAFMFQLLLVTVFQTWLLHKRLPVKKKAARKKKPPQPAPASQHNATKRHRAVTAEEVQPRE